MPKERLHHGKTPSISTSREKLKDRSHDHEEAAETLGPWLKEPLADDGHLTLRLPENVPKSVQMAEQTRSPHDDDPIRRLRETYTERMRIYERRDRVETYVLFIFLWFFFSMWAALLVPAVLGDKGATVQVLGAVACGLPPTLLLFGFRGVFFPKANDSGLLAWWDDGRRSR